MIYKTCPICGAALDPEERCDCNEYQNAATRGNLPQLAADCRTKKKPLRCYSTRTAGWTRF